jgi:FlhB-like protein
MAGTKTEQPTAKRLRDARKKGQVFKSNDLTQAFLFLAVAGFLSIAGRYYFNEIKALLIDSFDGRIWATALDSSALQQQLTKGFLKLFVLTGPLLATVLVVSAGCTFLQVGSIFAPEVVSSKWERLNPAQGLRNVFLKPRTYVELAKDFVKIALILGLTYLTLVGQLRDIALSIRLRFDQFAGLAGDLLSRELFRFGVALLILGAADYLIQKRLYMKDMMMSKDEIAKEVKQEEGDPHVKSRRKQLHLELVNQSALADVSKATAIVMSPQPRAVALRYEEATMNAPLVTAKGQNELAETIIDIAKKHDVPIAKNVELTENLYDLDIDSEVPERLYEAVAEILNWVYAVAQTEKSKQ